MKKALVVTAMVLLAAILLFAQIANPPNYVAPVNVGSGAAVGPAGVITTSGLVATVSAGPVYCKGAQESLATSSFTLTASTTYFLYFDCGLDQLFVSTSPGSTFQVPIAQLVAGASTIAVTDQRPVALFPPVGNAGGTAYLTGSAYTNATTTFSNVTGLAFNVAASQNYHAVCRITWQGSAGTTGPKYQFTGPAAPTSVAVGLNSPITAATAANASAVAFSSPVANAGTITTATNFTDTLDIAVLNGTTAGTVQLQAAANGAGTLTIQPGSSCSVQN